MPTTGAARRRPPIDPAKPAPPKLNTPPSAAVVQYPERRGGAEGGGESPAGAVKACTCVDDGASKRPSATVGVGKWFDSDPSAKLWSWLPVFGSSPNSVLPPMLHTNPPATMGGPPAPVLVCHSTFAVLGAAVAT